MGYFAAPLALPEPQFGLLVPGVLNGIDASSEDMLGKVPVCGQLDNGARVEVAVGIGGG